MDDKHAAGSARLHPGVLTLARPRARGLALLPARTLNPPARTLTATNANIPNPSPNPIQACGMVLLGTMSDTLIVETMKREDSGRASFGNLQANCWVLIFVGSLVGSALSGHAHASLGTASVFRLTALLKLCMLALPAMLQVRGSAGAGLGLQLTLTLTPLPAPGPSGSPAAALRPRRGRRRGVLSGCRRGGPRVQRPPRVAAHLLPVHLRSVPAEHRRMEQLPVWGAREWCWLGQRIYGVPQQ